MKKEAEQLVLEALAGETPVLVLRGTDKLARVGGDIDLMVPAHHAVHACAATAILADRRGWYVIWFRDDGYVTHLVLVQASEGCRAIKLDFADGLRWYARGKDRAGDYLFMTLRKRPEERHRLAGVVGYFQKTLAAGHLSEREFARVIATGADAGFIERFAAATELPVSLSDVGARRVTSFVKWRLRAASCGIRDPLRALPWFLRVSLAHLKFKLGIGTRAGLVIGISGMDGSGKSTTVDALLALFRDAGGAQPRLVHLLPSWIPMPHQLLRRKRTVANYTRPYAEPPVARGLGAALRFAYYVAGFALAKVALSLARWRGQVVVMDRSIIDFMADPTRSRIPVMHVPNWLVRWLVPRGLHLYLDVSPEIAVARKQELTLAKANALRSAYARMCAAAGGQRINADAPAHAVLAGLLKHVNAEYLKRATDAAARP